jgi:hypothetical protein
MFGNEIGMKVPDLIFICLFSIYIYINRNEMRLPKISLIFFFIILGQVLSEINGIINGKVLIVNDLIDFILTFEITAAFVVGYSLALKYENHKGQVFGFSFWLLIASFLGLSILILFNFWGVKEVLGSLYELDKSRSVSVDNTGNLFRLSSTFTNPNYFGLFICALSSIFVSLYFRTFNLKNLLGVLVCLSLVLVSGSRTALISFIFVVLFIGAFQILKYSRREPKLIISLTVVILILAFTLPIFIEKVMASLGRYTDLENMANSMNARFNAWDIALRWIYDYPLLGIGSNKVNMTSVDNNYIYLLYKNGLVGLGLYLLLFSFMSFISIRAFLKSNSKEVFTPTVAMVTTGLILTTLIGMLTAVPLNMVQFAVPLFLCLGFGYYILAHRERF